MNWTFANPVCPSWSSFSDESAIRSALARLSDDGASLHFWFKAWTAFVVVGVVLEIVFCICEYLEERHELRVIDLIPHTVPTLWLFVFAMFAASLVAVGVSGELKVEGQIEMLESCVRNGNDALYLLLSKEAGDAATSAKTARVEADAVKGIADEARTDAKDALEKSRTAQRELANAEADAAKAQAVASNALDLAQAARQDIDAAVRETEKLKQRMADRMLTDTQVDLIAAAVKQFEGQKAQFIAYWNDPECVHLEKRIELSLKPPPAGKGNWNVIPPQQGTMLLGGITGVLISMSAQPDRKTALAAVTLGTVLNKQGITTAIQIDNAFAKDLIEIQVGSKP